MQLCVLLAVAGGLLVCSRHGQAGAGRFSTEGLRAIRSHLADSMGVENQPSAASSAGESGRYLKEDNTAHRAKEAIKPELNSSKLIRRSYKPGQS